MLKLAALSEEVPARKPATQERKRSTQRQKNPFLECGSHQIRRSWERKWLENDADYLFERQEDLRVSRRQKRLSLSADSAEDLYERRTFYGKYSTKVRELRHRRTSGTIAPNPSPQKDADLPPRTGSFSLGPTKSVLALGVLEGRSCSSSSRKTLAGGAGRNSTSIASRPALPRSASSDAANAMRELQQEMKQSLGVGAKQ